jgi:hypothetical protein
MEIVSQNSDADIAKNEAPEDLGWPLRRLTANLLRIVRGAGAPYELPRQIRAVLGALREYEAAFGHRPSEYEIQQALELRERTVGDDFDIATEQIASGGFGLSPESCSAKSYRQVTVRAKCSQA